MKKDVLLPLFLLLLLGSVSCKKKENKGTGINIFSINDDKKLGLDMYNYVQDSGEYVVLDPVQYPEPYKYTNELVTKIIHSDDILHRDDFPWTVTLLKDDSILNAFATPGGYIYIYTGLIKYLDCEDHFAGVLGHEIAHADRRHSTQQLTKQYGLQFMLDLVLGKRQGALSNVTQSLITLSFGREAEAEADAYSVKYLCDMGNIQADGAAGFFKKLIAKGQSGNTPAFLSTHPSPESRVENIQNAAIASGCDTTQYCSNAYNTRLKNLLP